MRIGDNEYEFVRGSDIVRDGMFLEVSTTSAAVRTLIAEVFFSDISFKYTLSCFVEDVPLELIEALISRAKILLPPVKQ